MSGEYAVSLFAKIFLEKKLGARIVHDPRLIWSIRSEIKKMHGQPVTSNTGHIDFKKTMRTFDAIYGGEMSAHHYFKDFSYCDSGMIPWLLVWEFLSVRELNLADLNIYYKENFPSSGEINFAVANPSTCLKYLKNFYFNSAKEIDETDGLTMTFNKWRFNIRRSNTESLVRLNIETEGNEDLLKTKMLELKLIIGDFNGFSFFIYKAFVYFK